MFDISLINRYMQKINFNYAMNLSYNNKFAYMEIPKVACSTIKLNLQASEAKTIQGELVSSEFNVHNKEKSLLSSPFDDEQAFLDLINSKDNYIFTFVRNPFDRVLSAYLNVMKNNGDDRINIKNRFLDSLGIEGDDRLRFKFDFLSCLHAIENTRLNVLDAHFRPQYAQSCIELIDYDFIGRFENLEDDLNTVLSRIYNDSSRSIRSVTSHATSARNKLSIYYDEECIELVKKIYKKDFEYFDYSMELPI